MWQALYTAPAAVTEAAGADVLAAGVCFPSSTPPGTANALRGRGGMGTCTRSMHHDPMMETVASSRAKEDDREIQFQEKV